MCRKALHCFPVNAPAAENLIHSIQRQIIDDALMVQGDLFGF